MKLIAPEIAAARLRHVIARLPLWEAGECSKYADAGGDGSMTLTIDLGEDMPRPKGWDVDTTQRIHFADYTRADRTKRQIIEAIEGIEDPALITDYIAAESLVIDALYLSNWPHMAADIETAADEQRALLGVCPTRRNRDNSQEAETAQRQDKGNSMNQFANFDAGGNSGPLLLWSVQGTDGVPAESFYINEDSTKTKFAGFEKGVVMDVDSIRTGWQVWEGDIPKWTWNPSVSQMIPRPGDEHKKGWEVNCAIGGGKTVLWSQAGAASWGALAGLAPAFAQQPAGKCALVKMTGIRHERFNKGGKTAIPVLEVVKWVDRPDCLKSGFQAFKDEPAQTAQPAKPAVQPAPAPVDEEMDF